MSTEATELLHSETIEAFKLYRDALYDAMILAERYNKILNATLHDHPESRVDVANQNLLRRAVKSCADAGILRQIYTTIQ